MQRTTIMLPEELKYKAMQTAAKRGISLGELIRDSLEQACAAEPESADPFYSDTKAFTGDIPEDISAKHDDYLDESKK